MAKNKKPLAAVSPEDKLFEGMPQDLQDLHRESKSMRRQKKREEFANRMISDPETLGDR